MDRILPTPDPVKQGRKTGSFLVRVLLVGLLLFELLAWWGLGNGTWLTLGLGLTFWLTIGLSVFGVLALGLLIRKLIGDRFQIGLRTLFLSVAVIGAGLGMVGSTLHRTSEQRACAAAVIGRGAQVVYGREHEMGLKSLIGRKYFDDVVEVYWDCFNSKPELRFLAGFPALALLALNGPGVTDETLAELPSLANCRRLFLTQAVLSERGLSNLSRLIRLEELCLCRSKIKDDDLAPLGRLRGLTSLNIGETPISDAGLRHLLASQNLRQLFLHRTLITDAGLAHLHALSQLAELDLQSTAITDAGLVDLAKLKSLRKLNLEGTAVTDEGIETLRQALPGCQVR